jgi:hypothetical protein
MRSPGSLLPLSSPFLYSHRHSASFYHRCPRASHVKGLPRLPASAAVKVEIPSNVKNWKVGALWTAFDTKDFPRVKEPLLADTEETFQVIWSRNLIETVN